MVMTDAAPWQLDQVKTSSTLAYERLKHAIAAGDLKPGERLTELRIATLLGVSRTPVREAFARLIADGLLASAGRGGVTIVDPRTEIAEIYHLREAIEGISARFAAIHATSGEKREITSLAAASRATNPADVQARARINEAFHLAIATAAHAPRVARLVADYRALFASPLILRAYSPLQTETAQDAHRDIADAIARADPDAAEAAMRAHLRASYDFALTKAPPR
jgi:DNA-binding GntR family transcriptional regulator